MPIIIESAVQNVVASESDLATNLPGGDPADAILPLEDGALQIAGWEPRRLPAPSFPDQAVAGGGLPPTVANVQHLLDGNGTKARYDLVKKRAEVFIPGLPGATDNVASVSLTHVRSLMALHGMSYGDTRALVEAIANEHPHNPVVDWIDSRPWDGVDRLPALYATLETDPEYPQKLKEAVVRHWLLSAAAAVLIDGFSARLVLTLQGPQSIGKTRWCNALVTDPKLRAAVVKTDHHFSGGDKDNIITAMRFWIVELGEVESSFRKDAERLKGIISRDRDVVRVPYAAADSEWPRRTVFVASTNGGDFLSDPTGSTRWGVVPVVAVDHDHDVDMQQLWAQIAAEVRGGAQWWLDPEDEAAMEAWNERHQATSIVRDAVISVVDMEGDDTAATRRMTASEVLKEAGFDNPASGQAREAGAILRPRFGNPTKGNGIFRWNLPLRHEPDGVQDHRLVTGGVAPKSKFD